MKALIAWREGRSIGGGSNGVAATSEATTSAFLEAAGYV
jgi:hypothetical protein